MVQEDGPIDLEAFTAIDRQRLLRVLGRAIDEETARCLSGPDCPDGPGDRARLRFFCSLVSKIREMSDSGPGGRAAGSGRKGSRSL